MTRQAISFTDKWYRKKYALKFTLSDIEDLCKILLHSKEEIFTKPNMEAIYHYGWIKIGKNQYSVSSYRVKDLLFLISKGTYDKDDILFDVSRLLPIGKSSIRTQLWNEVTIYFKKKESNLAIGNGKNDKINL